MGGWRSQFQKYSWEEFKIRDRILYTCHDFIFVCIACYFFKMRIAAESVIMLRFIVL